MTDKEKIILISNENEELRRVIQIIRNSNVFKQLPYVIATEIDIVYNKEPLDWSKTLNNYQQNH